MSKRKEIDCSLPMTGIQIAHHPGSGTYALYRLVTLLSTVESGFYFDRCAEREAGRLYLGPRCGGMMRISHAMRWSFFGRALHINKVGGRILWARTRTRWQAAAADSLIA